MKIPEKNKMELMESGIYMGGKSDFPKNELSRESKPMLNVIKSQIVESDEGEEEKQMPIEEGTEGNRLEIREKMDSLGHSVLIGGGDEWLVGSKFNGI